MRNTQRPLLDAVTRASTSTRRRLRQMSRIAAEEGAGQIGRRALLAAARRFDVCAAVPPEVRWADVRAADIAVRRPVTVPPIPADQRLAVNWVTSPPSRNSGGHSTMFRLVEHLESLGHLCRLYLYDVYGSSADDHEATVRTAFPGFRGPVLDVRHGMTDAHAVFATAWPTAYPVFNDPCAGMRFYLVQDYEPWFYPAGTTATLAENTYRMGFHGFTAGRFLADKLTTELGMTADWFDFGCDRAVYRLLPGSVRDGVVFYARPNAARRAFDLGRLALELFSERHPDIEIHLYGSHVGPIGRTSTDHGSISPAALNELYNRCHAGLSLSMTNVSLVPHEMLAAGCTPVVNDAVHNRIVLDNERVRYAQATPHALTEALSEVVSSPDPRARADAAAASVDTRSWEAAGERLEKMLRRELGC